MSADSSRRSRAVFILFPQRALSPSFALPPSYVAFASPRRACRRLKKFISFGSTRGLGAKSNHSGDWLEFEYWFHLRGQLRDLILDARSYNIPYSTPLFIGRSRGNKSRRNCNPQCFVVWQGGPHPHTNKSAAAAVVVRHLRPLASSLFLVTRTAQSSSSLIGRLFFTECSLDAHNVRLIRRVLNS